jgi:NAD(P)-dependent dehydrogenase (short-subunit alcohol dehydrogenase family)
VLTELFKKNNPPAVAAKLVEHAIVGRAGTPEDIARAVLFLADRENGYITGQVLHVCGGSSLTLNW